MLEGLVVIGKGRTEPNKDWSQEDPHYKNGDSLLCNNDLFLYAVADGTSSFSTASEASSTAINILEEKFQDDKSGVLVYFGPNQI